MDSFVTKDRAIDIPDTGKVELNRRLHLALATGGE